MMKRNKDENKLWEVIKKLSEGKSLPAKYKDHPLRGEWNNRRDCHIEPDWLLIYQVRGNDLILERTGSHADLFE